MHPRSVPNQPEVPQERPRIAEEAAKTKLSDAAKQAEFRLSEGQASAEKQVEAAASEAAASEAKAAARVKETLRVRTQQLKASNQRCVELEESVRDLRGMLAQTMRCMHPDEVIGRR